MNSKAKKVTLQSLAATVEAGFKQMDTSFKEAKEDNESLARMVANGFEHTATKEDIKSVRNDIAVLEQGQENIQLRVDSLAPQFEVRQLERRVKRLEDKTGIRHTVGR